jgi:hypothetical protein
MRARWATGLIVSPLAATALLVAPTPGLVLSVVAALCLFRARGLPALAGFLYGTGVSRLAQLALGHVDCAWSYAGCWYPNFTAAVIGAAAVLITGAALTLALVVQARTGRASI